MAIFLTHGVLGAGMVAGPLRWTKSPRWLINAGAVYGFALGILADAAGWVLGAFKILPEFEVKEFFHENAPWYLMIQPPFLAHVSVDYVFHRYEDWWSHLWYLEIEMLVIGGLLLWVAYRKGE